MSRQAPIKPGSSEEDGEHGHTTTEVAVRREGALRQRRAGPDTRGDQGLIIIIIRRRRRRTLTLTLTLTLILILILILILTLISTNTNTNATVLIIGRGRQSEWERPCRK